MESINAAPTYISHKSETRLNHAWAKSVLVLGIVIALAQQWIAKENSLFFIASFLPYLLTAIGCWLSNGRAVRYVAGVMMIISILTLNLHLKQLFFPLRSDPSFDVMKNFIRAYSDIILVNLSLIAICAGLIDEAKPSSEFGIEGLDARIVPPGVPAADRPG